MRPAGRRMENPRLLWYKTLMTKICEKLNLSGSIQAPPSKSSQQRAIASAAVASGESRIQGSQLSEDSKAALGLSRALGARVGIEGSSIVISGSRYFTDRKPDGTEPVLELDCGESGLCMRMFSPIVALLSSPVLIGGRGSLLTRPMTMVSEPLTAMGIRCKTREGRGPLLIEGPLCGGDYTLDASESSQFLTGLLVALPLAVGDSVLRVSRLTSKGYIDLTIDTCAAFGVQVVRNESYSEFSIVGGQSYRPTFFRPEGDWSGAAFLVVAAALAASGQGLEIRGLCVDSSQPDKAILDASRLAGVPVVVESDALFVGRGKLSAFEFNATDCPDLFPPLAALAAVCPGRSVLHGIHRLASKESDRARSLADCFSRLGAEVELCDDTMLIRGGELHGGTVDSCGDHRIAMAAAVAALGASGPVSVLGAECVAKSWPSFFDDLESLAVRI